MPINSQSLTHKDNLVASYRSCKLNLFALCRYVNFESCCLTRIVYNSVTHAALCHFVIYTYLGKIRISFFICCFLSSWALVSLLKDTRMKQTLEWKWSGRKLEHVFSSCVIGIINKLQLKLHLTLWFPVMHLRPSIKFKIIWMMYYVSVRVDCYYPLVWPGASYSRSAHIVRKKKMWTYRDLSDHCLLWGAIRYHGDCSRFSR